MWACLCGPHLEALRYLLAQCPLERLLWGSDAGTGKADVYHYRMPLMEQVPLTPRQAEAIYRTNPQRLFPGAGDPDGAAGRRTAVNRKSLEP